MSAIKKSQILGRFAPPLSFGGMGRCASVRACLRSLSPVCQQDAGRGMIGQGRQGAGRKGFSEGHLGGDAARGRRGETKRPFCAFETAVLRIRDGRSARSRPPFCPAWGPRVAGLIRSPPPNGPGYCSRKRRVAFGAKQYGERTPGSLKALPDTCDKFALDVGDQRHQRDHEYNNKDLHAACITGLLRLFHRHLTVHQQREQGRAQAGEGGNLFLVACSNSIAFLDYF